MKTTIEMHGYEIVISESEEGSVSVQAMKDGEIMEEFQLEAGEEKSTEEMGTKETEGENEMMPFGGEEEEDFGGEEDEEDFDDDDDIEEEDETEEAEGKLESFNSFVRKRK